MSSRTPRKVKARADIWHGPDGSQTEIIRIFGGTQALSINYEQIPELLTRLDQLEREHAERQAIVNQLVINE